MRESMRSLAYGLQHVVESIPIEVNVDVVGDRSIGMSQKLRENFNIGTFVVMVRSKGMAPDMQTETAHTCLFADLFALFAKTFIGKADASASDKNKLVVTTEVFECAQNFNCLGGQGDDSIARITLGALLNIALALICGIHYSSVNIYAASLQVDIWTSI